MTDEMVARGGIEPTHITAFFAAQRGSGCSCYPENYPGQFSYFSRREAADSVDSFCHGESTRLNPSGRQEVPERLSESLQKNFGWGWQDSNPRATQRADQ